MCLAFYSREKLPKRKTRPDSRTSATYTNCLCKGFYFNHADRSSFMEWCGLFGNICQLLNICRTTIISLHSMKTSRYRDVTVFFVFLKYGEVVAGVSPHLSCLSRRDDLGHFAHRTLASPHFHIKYAVHGSNVNGKSIIETLNYLAVGTRYGLSSVSPGEIFYRRDKRRGVCWEF